MKILPQLLARHTPATPEPTAAPVEPHAPPPQWDAELRQLKASVQAMEAQRKEMPAPAAPDEGRWQQWKTEISDQLKVMKETFSHEFEAYQERLRSCEQAPRLLVETVLKDFEKRFQTQIEQLGTKLSARIEAVVVPAPAAVVLPPAPPPAVAPAPAAPAPTWDEQFERREKTLSAIMKEIVAAVPAPAPTVAVEPPHDLPATLPTEETVKALSEFVAESAPSTDFSEPLLPPMTEASSSSIVSRLWHYLNEPAFGGAPRPDDTQQQ